MWFQGFRSDPNPKCPVGRKTLRAAKRKCEGLLLWAQHPSSSSGDTTMSALPLSSSLRG